MNRRPLLIACLCLLLSRPDFGLAANPEILTTNFVVAPRVKLVISPTAINFPDVDPQALAQVPAAENPIVVTASFRKAPSPALPATLYCQGGSLISGADVIAADNISWTASGPGFNGGTLSDATPQPVASWTASGTYTGSLAFFLNNLWTYAAGNYSGSVTFTLTAP